MPPCTDCLFGSLKCGIEALAAIAGNDTIWHARLFYMRDKPAVHAVAQVLAVANTILHKGDFVAGNDIKVGFISCRDALHFGGSPAHVATLP